MAKEKSPKKSKKKNEKNSKSAEPRKASRKAEGDPVKTGKGASPLEVGQEFVDLFNGGKYEDIETGLWSRKVVSVEGMGVSRAWHGRKAVRAKNDRWMATHRIHDATCEGPYVGATGFAVRFSMDVEDTATGDRTRMNEVGVYTVERGKIVREEFMYGL